MRAALGGTGTILRYTDKQGRIHGISRSPSSFLPAEKSGYGPTDGPTDGTMDRRTHPLIESWLTTKKAMFGHRIGSLVGEEVVLVMKELVSNL